MESAPGCGKLTALVVSLTVCGLPDVVVLSCHASDGSYSTEPSEQSIVTLTSLKTLLGSSRKNARQYKKLRMGIHCKVMKCGVKTYESKIRDFPR